MPYSNIDKPSKYFNTVLYTGNGTNNRTITGVGFQPDFVWIKSRSLTTWNATSDVIRGANKTLFTNATDSEYTNTAFGYTSAFTSDGFTLTTGSSGFDNVNNNGATYASWNWLASNTTGSSNTQGSITSTVSANTTSGFSIVSYTGTGATATIGHGLGVAPKMIIVKQRSAVRDWVVGHSGIGWTKYLYLNSSQASATGNFFNDTTPSSTVFNVVNDGGVNASGGTYIAYCFAEVKGFSKFGSYTGNGSTDGTFVYTGFKPAFVLFKSSSAAYNWHIFDSKRNTYNVVTGDLVPNTSAAEDNGNNILDFLSNGFKLRIADAGWNDANTYIYAAFAENPFVSSKGIPTTAR